LRHGEEGSDADPSRKEDGARRGNQWKVILRSADLEQVAHLHVLVHRTRHAAGVLRTQYPYGVLTTFLRVVAQGVLPGRQIRLEDIDMRPGFELRQGLAIHRHEIVRMDVQRLEPLRGYLHFELELHVVSFAPVPEASTHFLA